MSSLVHNEQELREKEKGWLGFFVREYKVAFMVGFLVIAAGILSLLQIPKESAPFIPYGIVNVTTVYSGASAIDVDSLITQELENKIKNVAGISKITSSSSNGISSISIQFDPDENMLRAVSDIRSAVDEAMPDLPTEIDAEPHVAEIDSSLQPFVSFVLHGPYDSIQLYEYGDMLRQRLESLSGVAKADIQGGARREIRVDIDPVRLDFFGLTIGDVTNAIRASHNNIPLGNLQIGTLNYSLRFQGRHESVEDVSNLYIVDTSNGDGVSGVRIGELARVYEAPQENVGFYRVGFKGGGVSYEAVEVSVLKKQSTNIFDVDAKVREVVEEFQKKNFPSSLVVTGTNQLAEIIKEDYSLVFTSAGSSIGVIMLIIFIFIGFIEGLVASLVIPLAFLGTITFLFLQGSTLNFMTNFSMILSLGILVDTAIVIVEGAHDYIKRGYSPHDAAILALHEFSQPLLSGALTTLAVFIPLLGLPGVLGKYISFIPITVSIILMFSLGISLFLIPAFASKILHVSRNKQMVKRGLFSRLRGFFDRFNGKLISLYGRAIFIILNSRKWRLAMGYAVLAMFFLSMMLPIKFELFPEGDGYFVRISVEEPVGTIEEETLRKTVPVEQILLKQPEVKLITTSARGNSANIYVELFKPDERKTMGLRTSIDFSNDLKERFATMRESNIRVQNAQSGPPSAFPVGARVIAVDSSKLDAAQGVIQDFKKILTEIPGTFGVDDDMEITPGEIRFTVYRDRALALGISPDSVPLALRGAFAGSSAATITRNGQDIDVVVGFDENSVDSIDNIESLQIRNGRGARISLSQIAGYQVYYGLNTIRRVDNNIAFTVSSLLDDDGNAAEITDEFFERIKNYKLPDGIRVINAGENEENSELFAALGSGALVAFLIMLLILVIQFHSFLQPFMILATLVFAMIGVNVGLFITGTPRSLAFILGIIALMGIVVNDAIIMMDQINNNRKKNHDPENPKQLITLIAQSARSRFTPIVLTTLTTAAGILPLAFVDTFWAGLSYTVIFGLCMATFMTLFVTPAMYFQSVYEKAITGWPVAAAFAISGVVGTLFFTYYVAAVILGLFGWLFVWLTKRSYRKVLA